jgi:hypothetical protein
MINTTNQSPTPEEWKAATDYALMLSEKMLKASEERSQGDKREEQHLNSAA